MAKVVVFIMFVLYFLIGISIFADYGVSDDGPAQRVIGQTNYQYILVLHYDFKMP